MTVAAATYAVNLELAVGSLTDVTSYITRATCSRKIATILDNISVDNAMLELEDQTGQFAPLRGSLAQPGRQLQLSTTYVNSDGTSATYALFTGRVTGIRNTPTAGENQTTFIEAISDVDRLVNRIVTTSLFLNINAGSLFTEIMTLCAVASYAADTLTETVPFAWYQARNVVNAMDELVQSGNYYMYVDGAGTIRLKKPTWGFGLDSIQPYVNSGYVLDGYFLATAEFAALFDMQYSLTNARILNSVKIDAQPRTLAQSLAVIAQIAAPILLPSSGAIGFFLTYQDPLRGNQACPVGSFAAQVSSTDYFASANSDGTGTNFTSTLSLRVGMFGESAVCTVVNGSSGSAWLTRFQIQGYPVRESGLTGFQTDDSSSQAVYGLRAIEMVNIIQDFSYISSLATYVLSGHKNAQADLHLTLVNEFPAMLAQELGGAASVVNSVTGVNSPWIVFGLQHDITLVDGVRHQMDFDLRFF